MRRRVRIWVWALLVSFLVGWMPAAAEDARQAGPPGDHTAFAALAPGLEYRHDVRPTGPLSIHVLRISRQTQGWELRSGLGMGTVFGLEPLAGIVARTSSASQKTALAASNGDFFVIKAGPYQGDPRGLQIANGELVSRPTGNSFWIEANGEPRIGTVTSKLRAVWPDGRTEIPMGLNEARPDDGVVLFTPTLGVRPGEMPKQPPTTRTQGGRELVLGGTDGCPWLPISAGVTYSARIREIRDEGKTPLAADKTILSIGPKALGKLPATKVGDVVRLAMETRPDLKGVRTAIGGGRILIRDGRMPDVGRADQPRHPRSMIGWNRQYLLLFVIDGRQPGLSIGMTYPEMAALAGQYQCTNAIELDGGGSSTLWAMGKILNSPSDGRPRAIANGLILLKDERAKP